MSPIHPPSGAALALLLATPLPAQQAPAPQPERILPPIRYSLPPGEGSTVQEAPPVVVAPPPVVVPRPTPTPRATPTPRPTQSARPAPPTPRPTATPTPAAAVPAPVPTPEAVPVPAETAPATASPAPEAVPDAPEAAAPDAGGYGWLLAVLVAAIAAGAALFWWRRRSAGRAATEADGAVMAEPEPAVETPAPVPAVPAPGPAPVAPPPAEPDAPQFLSRPAGPPLPPRAPIPAGTITAFRDRPKPQDAGFVTAFRRPAPTLGIELQPIRAGTDEETGFVEFQFAFVNASDQAVGDMMVSAWMLTANAEQATQIAAFLAEPADPSQHTLYALQPGEHREHRAAMGERFEHLHIVEAGGRRFFAPIILIDARYRAQGGGEGRSSAAFVVGRPNPATGKLLPIYVDRGARIIEGLAARPYPLPRPQAA